MKKRIQIVAVLALVGAASALTWRFMREKDFYYAGTIEATEVSISPRVSSVIALFNVKEGDSVENGQVLVHLAGEDLKLVAEQARRDYERAQRLLKDGTMTQEVYDRIAFRYKDAALKVSWCTIESPLNGTVLNKYFEPGEQVSPGMKLLTLADLNEVWAIVYVPQPMLVKISLGMKVKGYLPELKMRAFEGKVTHISDQAEFTPKNVQTRDERTRLVYGIKVTFPNPDKILKPGMSIEVEFPK